MASFWFFCKRLGKNPEQYPDAKSQPHVQVALRLKQKGGSAKTGDVIPYVFCLSEGEESTKTAQADRAKHPDEVRKSSELTIGRMIDDSLFEMPLKFALRLRLLFIKSNSASNWTSMWAYRGNR